MLLAFYCVDIVYLLRDFGLDRPTHLLFCVDVLPTEILRL